MDRHSQLSPIVRDRAHQPRNYGPLYPCDGHAQVTGPCGDTMEFWIRVYESRIVAIGFTTTGCGTSRAAGSMATELALGQSLERASCIEQADILQALAGLPAESEHCALLASSTLKAAVGDAAILESTECDALSDPLASELWGSADNTRFLG
jgi:nitrogen fixation NifU-like protein